MIVTYQPDRISEVWYFVEPFVKKAVDNGCTLSLKDIYHKLCEAKLQLWTWQTDAVKSVMITAIVVQEVKYCLLMTMSGTGLKEWVRELPKVEDWARSVGCESMRINGRKGWARVLGYTVTGRDSLGFYVMERQLWAVTPDK